MKRLIFILTIPFLIGCGKSTTSDNAFKTSEDDIEFPIEAKFKNPEGSVEDTLIATVNKINFVIAPEGKLSWGQIPLIQLI
jgi:hypothetical protein